MPLGRKHLRRNRDAPNLVGLAFKELLLLSHPSGGCQMGNQPHRLGCKLQILPGIPSSKSGSSNTSSSPSYSLCNMGLTLARPILSRRILASDSG